MILCDSNIFLIDRFFRRDVHYDVNHRFLERASEFDASVAIYSLLEMCGLASFNLSIRELEQWFYHFDELYRVKVLYPKDLDQTLETYLEKMLADLFKLYGKRMTWLDAEILMIAEAYAATYLVTWNKKDFVGRTDIRVVTPEEFMAEQGKVPESG